MEPASLVCISYTLGFGRLVAILIFGGIRNIVDQLTWPMRTRGLSPYPHIAIHVGPIKTVGFSRESITTHFPKPSG
jgi:hypothetical protein